LNPNRNRVEWVDLLVYLTGMPDMHNPSDHLLRDTFAIPLIEPPHRIEMT